jgi:antirestriction protein ArdC
MVATSGAVLLRITVSWRLIKVLKDDKRAIFAAASHAQRAVDFLNGLQLNSAIVSEGAIDVAA